MSDSQQARPAAQTPETDPEMDPEIQALLDFQPVPRKVQVEGGWSGETQRRFIARLALHGSACRACEELDKNRTGATRLYRSPRGASFRAAWDSAVALAKRRKAEREAAPAFVSAGLKAPTLDHRRKSAPAACPQCGRKHASAEEEAAAALARQAEEARERIVKRVDRLRQRRMRHLSGDAAKRHAFEVLYGPVDWDNRKSYSVFSESDE
jgi:Zn ribbon nucleic-acid-binding protein